MTTEPTTEAAIREIQNTALSRALTDDDHARQSFAVAGALETARRETSDASFDGGGVALAASLTFISTLFAHRRLRDSLRSAVRATDDSAWYPSGVPARVDTDLVVAGARLAVRRFDVTPSQASVLADVNTERIEPDE
ncbi:hypothetical protein E6P09_12150 [Haloferax mediterranei ATCC 33500]|uniref:Uncharacterized protein n=1 Tax=Haloferax mediterranei (strain ATCC 33500 / DSM 1411 / JCM 8866 / NBRC 14739 / NCIMB 2177 / R-4) TaxID=523841 RepID=I3R8N6_HALMT|nr:hypothetical protein [Haloferax mediterranei]AFK20596.1 hypothetical protein HFX_2927 [Haloferax mediterranei ATCC 33500]AHZ23950.1 hypothetical protein BM92_15440 [Haloferax mediterranei ATCC 33500]ELZ98378.1 hypothetical protein C439_16375 [Haloferax mediterranei ATCC 33500]MDX5986649.1 hypothetical protein [Haloferax mediterranei ATCC 33500]QCQ75981.1 hypothetical protein E6P09_12150 [Haloferax mediterranei ATCC 33500]